MKPYFLLKLAVVEITTRAASLRTVWQTAPSQTKWEWTEGCHPDPTTEVDLSEYGFFAGTHSA